MTAKTNCFCPLMNAPLYDSDMKEHRYHQKCVSHACRLYPLWFVRRVPPCQYMDLKGFEN